MQTCISVETSYLNTPHS